MKVAIVNLGQIVSGDWHHPFVAGDAIIIEGDRIKAVGTASGVECSAIHSSMIRQVVVRAARPVSMPRWPPGTISKRTSEAFGSSRTSERTELIGAMPSVLPANTSTGRVIASVRMSWPLMSITPSLSALLRTIRW